MPTTTRHAAAHSTSPARVYLSSPILGPPDRVRLICRCTVLIALLFAWAYPNAAWAVNKEWDGSSSQDFNTAANWTPSGVPTIDDDAFIRVLGANVTLSGGVGVANLTVSGGSKLSTSGQLLFVNGTIMFSEDAGTVSLTVNPGPLGLAIDTDFLTIGAGAELIMAGGVAQVDSRVSMSSTGTIRGFGVIEQTTSSILPEIQNDGLIDVSGGVLTFRRGIPSSIMTVDLDGQSNNGAVTVTNGTSSLVVDAPVKDAMNGMLTVGDGNTVTFNEGWTLGDAAAPAAKGTLTLTGGAAGSATIAGTASTLSGNVNVTEGTGVFTTSVAFTSSAAVSVSPGATLSLAGPTTFDGGAYTGAGQISQDANATVATSTTISTGVYDMDGPGASQITVAKDATLALNVQTLDDADDLFEGTLSLNGGSLNVNVFANQWTMGGTLNLIETGGTPGQVLGEKVQVQGAVNVSRIGRITGPVDFLAGSTNVHVNGDDARLELMGATSFAGGSYSGSGTLQTNGAVTVASDTRVAVGVFDLDGTAETTTTTINSGAKLTINVGSFESGGVDTLNGAMTLNGGDLDVAVADGSWTLAAALNLTQNGAAIPQITGNTLQTSGLITVNGAAEMLAPLVQAGGGIQLSSAGSNLRLSNATLLGAVTGSGTLTLNGPTAVPLITAINCTTFDWDGDVENSTTTIAPGAFFTVGAAQLEDDGGGYDGTTILGDAARLRFLTATVWSINTGTLRLQGTAEFSGTADISVTSASGKIEGTGTIAADVTTAGKTSPGLSAGVLHVAGNFTQQATGLLQIELGGTALSAYDRLEVFQTATLAGTLDVDLIGGFMPSAGDQFTVLTFNSRVGDFTYTGLSLGGGLTLMPVFSANALTLVAMASSLLGDANMDGKVDIFDVNVVSANWATTGPTGDVNGDNMVNIFDVNVISANWTGGGGGGAAAVPEPASALLFGLAFCGLAARTILRCPKKQKQVRQLNHSPLP